MKDLPWTCHPPTVDEADLLVIEEGADRILADVGLRFEEDPETLDVWREHGAIVRQDRVFLDGPSLRRIIRENAPSHFALRARNPRQTTIVGSAQNPVLAPVYGAPSVLLKSGERSAGSLALYRELVSIAHSAPGLGNTGHMICVLNDVPEAARPMEMAIAHLAFSDKPFMGTVASPVACQQVIDAVRLATGGGARDCHLVHLINSTPPLVYKANPLKCLRVAAQNRQASLVTSYMMMGATSPVTAAGALIQGYAEVLAGLALAQLWSPGAPVVMGLFAVPFSMRSMLPCFGDPSTYLIQLYGVQLARRLGVPVRGDGGITSAKVDDAQAGGEGAVATAASIRFGADFILHSTGWLENGRCVSIEKFRREAAEISTAFSRDSICPPPLALDQEVERELRAWIPA